MKLKQIVAPTEPPVSLKEAKAFYRILGDEEDADIARSINAATEKAEQITNLQLGAATWEGYLDIFPLAIMLPKSPLISVTKVEYIDTNGAVRIFTDYTVDDIAIPSVVYFTSSPEDMRQEGVNNFVITFESGYTEVPEAIKSWILIYGLTLFENRENIVIGASFSAEGKQYYDHLLDSYRIIPV